MAHRQHTPHQHQHPPSPPQAIDFSDEDEDDDLFNDDDTINQPAVTPSLVTPYQRSGSGSHGGSVYNPFNQPPPSFQGYHHRQGSGSGMRLTSSSSRGNFHSGSSSYGGTLYNDWDDDDYEEKELFYDDKMTVPMTPGRSKTVKFNEPEYPPLTYSPGKKTLVNVYDYDLEENESNSGSSSAGIGGNGIVTVRGGGNFVGDDYMINPLLDADEDDSLDPFGDDESLFLETGEEIMRRGTTIRRANTNKSKNARLSVDNDDVVLLDEDDDDFKPKLTYTKTIKKAKLINGNYVIDMPVPESLLDTYGQKISANKSNIPREMSFVRYTAVTCGPSNFVNFNYNLRQELYEPPRTTEIMVCITMYNEDEILLGRTLKGVFDNIRDLTNRSDPHWGDDSWKKIVVCIVNDGRLELNKRTETLLKALGIFQDGFAKSKINDKSVKSHIYEYTSTVGIDTVNDRVHLTSNSTPVQFLFCLKEKNSRKINSHRWCFQAFCPIIQPKIIMLLDCGTKPSKDAFFYLWRAFKDENVAGACGEMRTALGPSNKLLINPLVAAQNFEYKISNVLDKPMESVFGFISVLPGAFSAYRYEALLNVNGEGPLEKYFKGEYLHQNTQVDEDEEDDERGIKEKNFQEAGIFTSNMYLAEDRILCFELVAKKNHNYILRYVNEAKAETDVPEHIDEFVLQRRRWLNGSMFAAGYAVFHWTKIWRSNHSLFRKLFLQLEFYYQLVTILVSWFSLASFFLVFRILTANLGADDMHFNVGKYLAVIFLWFYVGSVVCTFVLAFGNTPRGTKKFYLVIAIFFAVLMAYMMFAAIFLAVHTVTSIVSDHKTDFSIAMVFTNTKFRDLVVSMVSTYLLYFIGAFMYGEPSFMFTSFVQYVLLSPTYINVLNIYAFCNIHDVSWGTKGVEIAKDLGSAKSFGKNNDELVMIAPENLTEELNDNYVHALESLREIPPVVIPANVKKSKDDSYYAFVRTITVLVWMLTNAILIAIVLESAGVDIISNSKDKMNADGSISGNSQVFLTIILWIVAGLALFRFIGAFLFLVFKGFRPLKWKLKERKNRKKNKSS
ncbi:Chitin synthase 2 [Candida viswanathii]|uniref:chitin synthase n=1 Tax=Candida viswanathii TaxID=5486 RepID=A0A367XMJ7_9ASCO|nr:Chitin synthase 2 [Candida viswanathii]